MQRRSVRAAVLAVRGELVLTLDQMREVLNLVAQARWHVQGRTPCDCTVNDPNNPCKWHDVAENIKRLDKMYKYVDREIFRLEDGSWGKPKKG